MNGELTELRRMFNRRLNESARTTFYGTVESVDKQQRTCSVRVGDISYEEVLLYTVVDGERKGQAVFPAVGSMVLVTRVGGSDRLFVDMFSEVESIDLTIGGELSAHVDAGGVTLTQGGGEEEESENEQQATKQVSVSAGEGTVNILIENTSFTIEDGSVKMESGDTVFTQDDGQITVQSPGVTARFDDGGMSVECSGTQLDITADGMELTNGATTFRALQSGISIKANGADLLTTLSQLCMSLAQLQVPTSMGPSGIPLNVADFMQARTSFEQLKS